MSPEPKSDNDSLQPFDLLEKITKWAENIKSNAKGQPQNKEESINNFLDVYIRAVKIKADMQLRNTQRLAIMTLLLNKRNTLAQVSTGEGKSLIISGVAICRALFLGEKVDVITSNNVLAKRDSSLTMDQGGLRDLYKIFSINVAHNCSENKDDRVKVYDSAVVYGELANFQRDYLLDHFYGRNIRGDRKF